MNYELSLAMLWWNELTDAERGFLSGNKRPHNLTGREILTIFKQQNK